MQLSVGQKVFVRNYKNPNKAVWSPAIVEKSFGPRNYSCLLTHNNRVIKRHIDQLRTREEHDNNETLDNEQVEARSHMQPNVSTSTDAQQIANNSIENGGVLTRLNELVPDVFERPERRSAATKARDLISRIF